MLRFGSAADRQDLELWNGPRTGLDGAVELFGADEAFDIAQLSAHLRPLLEQRTSAPFYVDLPDPEEPDARGPGRTRSRTLGSLLASATAQSMSAIDLLGIGARKSDHDAVVAALFGGKSKASRPIKSLSEELDRLRLIKSPSEIKLMRAAGEAASLAHADAMAFAEPDMTEAVLCARFEYQCALAGAERLAYVPVCASGPSALTMHYTANDRPLQRGSLVLFDAGCERHGYASDITRTFPVDGTFSSAQRDLYEALLTVQKACVALCAAGEGVSLQDLHRRSFGLLRRELIRLGFDLPTGALERTLHPHFLGHPVSCSPSKCADQLARHGPARCPVDVTSRAVRRSLMPELTAQAQARYGDHDRARHTVRRCSGFAR